MLWIDIISIRWDTLPIGVTISGLTSSILGLILETIPSNTANTHNVDHQECVNNLLRSLNPLSNSVNNFIRDSCTPSWVSCHGAHTTGHVSKISPNSELSSTTTTWLLVFASSFQFQRSCRHLMTNLLRDSFQMLGLNLIRPLDDWFLDWHTEWERVYVTLQSPQRNLKESCDWLCLNLWLKSLIFSR